MIVEASYGGMTLLFNLQMMPIDAALPENLGLPTAKSMPTAPVGINGHMPTAKGRP